MVKRRVRYVIRVISWAPCFIDVSLIEAHNVSRRLNGVPSVPGTPPSMPYPLHGLCMAGASLSHGRPKPDRIPSVSTLLPRWGPYAWYRASYCFFRGTWYGLDGLLDRATLYSYFSQQTGGRCCNKSPASHLYWEDAGLPDVLGCFSCQVEIFVLFPSHKPLPPPMVQLILQHMPAFVFPSILTLSLLCH